jgi:hypothetical protein
MKKFLNKDKSNFLYGMLIAVLCGILFTACQKNNAKPAAPPAQAPPSTNNTSLTAQEQQLVGNWIMDSCVYYTLTGSRISVLSYTNTLTCRMDFSATGTPYKTLTDGHFNCTLIQASWSAPNTGSFLASNVVYPISILTNNQLCFLYNDSGHELRYYLHK